MGQWNAIFALLQGLLYQQDASPIVVNTYKIEINETVKANLSPIHFDGTVTATVFLL